ncbi:UNC-50-like protein [Gymnopus androsaceus JB14]|uniref:UNC-50-like protein n=1 Tax=Gymnopus androsaceus JB14 TaxID=1447944 RepID=A0A6A4H112_9AGAR|nr:UNC-50-like protein [Gymnopus androsaceus JB14]
MDLPYSGNQVRSPAPISQRLPLIFRRLHRFNQMDFEQAIWQLGYLCLAPRRVYRNVYFHKQTKNTWARDDPAIIILIAACLFVAGLAWSFAYSYTARQALELILLVSNRLLVAPPSHSSPADSSVEWAYAFDVHTNAFFPFFLTLYVAQLFILPVVLKENWVCLFLGNTLYLAGFAQYVYGVYLGLNALPFLIRSELLLSPLLPLFTAYIISLLGFNVAKYVLAVYFGP